ncbi:MAG: hypothetical protein HC929_14700 [Leptolyngbyaceae cyanobacterium SM2_5_2]|nr:hypothetical protein [Leptolyngbyaceae cyanobacterium SM2_5_2]
MGDPSQMDEPEPFPPSGRDHHQEEPPLPPSLGTCVYGQKQVQQLLDTLFPHRQSLNGVASENKP